jgi:hypothetical protein
MTRVRFFSAATGFVLERAAAKLYDQAFDESDFGS